ncbi:MAG: DUF1684 domain-containing protein [Motilibacteraceae bacterium]
MSLALLDWRRRVAALYAHLRAESDPAQGHRAWVEGRADLLRHHPESPVPPDRRATYPGPPVAPYAPALRFEVPLVRDGRTERREVATGTDGVVPFDRLGLVELPGLGTLDVWWLGSYGGGLFLPLRDGLAGARTYGGGRYLLDTVKGADLGGDVGPDGEGTLVVDLNFSYNPSCAYDPSWACPLPGPGNRLDAPVEAGELMP